MSFNTSWGSSTRQDHPTFMSGTQPSNSGRSRDTTSFSKQQNNSGASSTATISYAIGPSATTSPTRSPKKLTSTRSGPNASISFSSSRANSSFAVEIPFPNEAAAERHLRLSQKHEARIETVPEPDEKAPKDTSVNIASAFHQATAGPTLSAAASMNGKPLSANSSRSNLRGAASDRLAAPQLPSSRYRPPTSTQEEDISEGTSARLKRAVSPIIEGAGQVVSAGIRAVSPGLATASQALMTGASTLVGPSSFALREPRQTQYQSFRIDEESYDYAQEEALADALPSSQTNGTKGLTKRKSLGKRVNEDNRAYKPPPEGQESDSSDDGTKTRKKGIVVQRSLITGAPAPSKKRSKRKSSGHTAGSEDGSTTVQRAGSNQSRAGSTLQANSRQGSLQPAQFSREDIEDVEEVEDEVQPPDADDSDLQEPEFQDDGVDEESSQTHSLTIGARLGKATNGLIHLVVKSVGMVLLIVWNTLRSMYELLVDRPKAFVAGGWREVKHFSDLVNPKAIGVLVLIWAIWYATFSRPSSATPSPIPSRRGWFDFLPSFRRRPVYVAPEVPVGSVEELIDRLHILEGAFVTLQAEHRSSVDEYRKGIQQLESNSRQSDGSLTGRLMAIENRLEGESRRAISAEETDRQATRKSVKSLEDLISSVRNEVSALHVAVAQQSRNDRTVDPRADERIGALEKEMRDVYERLKTITVTDKKGRGQPVAVDGKDLAKVVQEIISKDGVAMADYALYYSGGVIEPRTTSKTLAIRPGSWVGKDVRGRPPVTALVPDNSVGNCWPFAGSKAQLGIRLSRVVHLTHITIDHPARELLIDPESAPRKFHVWVAIEGQDNIQRAEIFNTQQEEKARRTEIPAKPFGPWNLLHVGTFEYNINDAATAQTFELPAEYQALGVDTGAIVVDFNSNWGADHTCVYRVRAHGSRVGA